MERKEKHVIGEIAQLREAIRKKYKLFRRGKALTELNLEKKYKPILKELKKNTNIPKKEPKIEPKDEPDNTRFDDTEFEPHAFSSPHKTLTEKSILGGEETFGDADESSIFDVLNSEKGIETASQYVQDHFTHPLTRKYMIKLMKDAGGKTASIDHTYGPRFNDEILMVGDKPVTFDEDGSIIIMDTRYKPTEGLYELLFKRIPDDELYNDEDLNAYKDIMLKTNAHRKNYQPRGHVNRNNSLKYRHVISKLFPKQLYGGTGFLMKSLARSVPVYWDDPNELCDRLRLLVASAQTGNTAHKNEIISIIEELKEAGIIKGRGNPEFLALLK